MKIKSKNFIILIEDPVVKREGPTANIIIKEVRAIKKQEELHIAKMATKKTEDSPPIQSI